MRESRVSLPVLISAVRKLWWAVALAGLLGAVGAFGYASQQAPNYRSTATVYFALDQGKSATDLNQGSAYTQNQMLSFALLATSSRVLQPVIDDLGLGITPALLAQSLQISIPQSTVTLRITANSLQAQRSAELANAVADELIDVVKDVAPKAPEGSSSITAQIIDEAVTPAFQSSPNRRRNTIIGGFLGGVIGLAAVMLFSVLDTRLRTEDALRNAGEDPVLGVVHRDKDLAAGGVSVSREPMGFVAEEFRRLRSALAYTNVGQRNRVLLLTSVTPGDGKSTISVNLGATLAMHQDSVLLIDADLRRPKVHEHLGIDREVGLTDLLLGVFGLDEVKYQVPGSGMDVLTSGGIPLNPTQLLTSAAMAQLIDQASKDYDWVIIDSPPTLSVADAALLAPLVDGVIVVVGTKTRQAAFIRCVEGLEASGARILGTVLNGARVTRRRKAY